ncbi:hypothetical protein [Schaalia canis]|uniref:SHIRT domain-containing protein n=1 Tax=Schaalia canis TaxID=100469 RepID=A0A3P1SF36_9ACTO|nr:hypothetical protein [Schaalia canis]RRC95901.1 hypothetical protein EII11_03350 [Schaalia canis]
MLPSRPRPILPITLGALLALILPFFLLTPNATAAPVPAEVSFDFIAGAPSDAIRGATDRPVPTHWDREESALPQSPGDIDLLHSNNRLYSYPMIDISPESQGPGKPIKVTFFYQKGTSYNTYYQKYTALSQTDGRALPASLSAGWPTTKEERPSFPQPVGARVADPDGTGTWVLQRWRPDVNATRTLNSRGTFVFVSEWSYEATPAHTVTYSFTQPDGSPLPATPDLAALLPVSVLHGHSLTLGISPAETFPLNVGGVERTYVITRIEGVPTGPVTSNVTVTISATPRTYTHTYTGEAFSAAARPLPPSLATVGPPTHEASPTFPLAAGATSPDPSGEGVWTLMEWRSESPTLSPDGLTQTEGHSAVWDYRKWETYNVSYVLRTPDASAAITAPTTGGTPLPTYVQENSTLTLPISVGDTFTVNGADAPLYVLQSIEGAPTGPVSQAPTITLVAKERTHIHRFSVEAVGTDRPLPAEVVTTYPDYEGLPVVYPQVTPTKVKVPDGEWISQGWSESGTSLSADGLIETHAHVLRWKFKQIFDVVNPQPPFATSAELLDAHPELGAPGAPLSLVTQGLPFTLDARGFTPLSMVDIYSYSTPRLLGTVTADAQGRVSTSISIPVDLSPGIHFLTLRERGSAKPQAILKLNILRAPVPPGGGQTPGGQTPGGQTPGGTPAPGTSPTVKPPAVTQPTVTRPAATPSTAIPPAQTPQATIRPKPRLAQTGAGENGQSVAVLLLMSGLTLAAAASLPVLSRR